MQILYMATAEATDATQASLPWHLAVNGSVEAGQDAVLVIGGDAAEVVAGDTIEKTEGMGLPPLRELVAKAREHEVPVYV